MPGRLPPLRSDAPTLVVGRTKALSKSLPFTLTGVTGYYEFTDRCSMELAFGLLAAELLAMDMACSRFRADSELWRVNHAAVTRSGSARC